MARSSCFSFAFSLGSHAEVVRTRAKALEQALAAAGRGQSNSGGEEHRAVDAHQEKEEAAPDRTLGHLCLRTNLVVVVK